ncbi:MAG: HDOD domain-containing protein [Deltaproteobacteria bacterium]|nr:HDOD domain-containing protein [Deltaproteobacteria bacterium]
MRSTVIARPAPTVVDKPKPTVLKIPDLPAMPAIAARVMKLLADPMTDAERLRRVISADPALTARVLRIANSAFYGCPREIRTLTTAISVIGFRAIRNLVLGVSAGSLFERAGLAKQLFWDHAVGAAIVSCLIAGQIRRVEREEAFIAGLLHDIGQVLLYHADPDRYRQVLEAVYNDGADTVATEDEILGFNHTELGGQVIHKWKLFEDLEMAVRFHHSLPPELPANRGGFTLAAVVNLADQICTRLGIGRREPDEGLPVDACPGAVHLGFTGPRAEELLRQAEQTYQKEREAFQECQS